MSDTAFAARLYAAQLPSAGVPVTARFAGGYLIVEGLQRAQIMASVLSVTAGGFNHDTLFLAWTQGGARYSLQPADKAAQALLLRSAPASTAGALKRWPGGMQRPARAWWLLGAVTAAVLLALVAAWWQSNRMIDWLAAQVSAATEAQLGAATLEQLRASSTLVEEGPAADALKAIGDRLVTGSRYAYHWAIKGDASVNAFALPGGYVVVHSGLIAAAKSADELAGVLAHEVQHVERRHTLKGMVHALGWASVLTVVLGDISAATGVLVYQAGQLGYSRALETEADRLGVRALAAANIDPAGMAAFFRSLSEQTDAPIALLSSHPASRERLAAIEADIASLPPQAYAPLAIDWPALQAAAAAVARPGRTQD